MAAQPTEIGGLAKIRIDGDDVYVEDIAMIEQDASAITFNIDKDDIQKFTLKMVQEGKDDEIHQWCSIVHSHPIGMGAEMSLTDVDAIKRFAEDQDAFSLIISTASNRASLDMKMHYCANIKGRQVVFNDMPVHVCYNAERLKEGERLAKNLAKHFGILDSPEDMKVMENACQSFMGSKVPHIFSKDRNKLRKDIEAEVKRLIKVPPKKTYAQYTAGNDASSGYQYGGGYSNAWAYGEDEEWAAEMMGSSMTKELLNPTIIGKLKSMEFLYGQAFLQENCPDERKAKARRAWERLTLQVNEVLRQHGGVGVGDMVRLNPNEAKITPENRHLTVGDHEVQSAYGQWNLTLYVDGEAFFPEELILIKPFDQVIAEEAEFEKQQEAISGSDIVKLEEVV